MYVGMLFFCCQVLFLNVVPRRLFFISKFQRLRNGGQALWQNIRKGQIIGKSIPI